MNLFSILVMAVLGLALLACIVMAAMCLRSVVKPYRHTVETMRAQEERMGTLDLIRIYEEDWARTPFTLESNGVVLSGEVIRNPADTGERKKVVILCHGHTVNRYGAIKYATVFYRAGFSLILYDERYFGQSTGDRCTLGQDETGDLVNMIAYARRLFGEDCLLGLHGESMGGATVLLALAHARPDFVVADCPFARSMLLFEHIVQDNLHLPPYPMLWFVDPIGALLYRYRPGQVNPIDAAAGSDVPICFMHGRADTLIPCSHSEMMAKVCRNPASRLHLFEGSEHACSFIDHRQEYEAAMLEFISQATGEHFEG